MTQRRWRIAVGRDTRSVYHRGHLWSLPLLAIAAGLGIVAAYLALRSHAGGLTFVILVTPRAAALRHLPLQAGLQADFP